MKKGDLTSKLIHNLQRLLGESKLSLQEFSDLTKIPISTLYSIMSGSSNDPKLSTLLSISSFFNINLSQLVGEVSLNVNEVNVPIISWDNINYRTGAVEISITSNTRFISIEPKTKNAMFAIYAEDKLSYKYKENSLVIIEISEGIKNLDTVLLSINNTEPVFKKVLIEGPITYLESVSHNIPVIQYDKNSSKVFGIVREIRITS